MIVLWLSQDAALTPPFALGAFIAAGIAQCDPMETGFKSLKLAKPLYVIPLLMAYTPILMDGPWNQVILVWMGAALAFICSSAVLEGYFIRALSWADRAILSAAALALFWNGIWFKVAGLALMVGNLVVQRSRPHEIGKPEFEASVSPVKMDAEKG
jgi:TRAP-type uncharacterized transport system fused permease subunit